MSEQPVVTLHSAKLSDFNGVEQSTMRCLSSQDRREVAVAAPWSARELAHAIKRLVLAEMTGLSPYELKFRRGVYGKPELDDEERSVVFNLSHSGDGAYVATARGIRLGVDLQRHRQVTNRDSVAASVWPRAVETPALVDDDDFFMRWTLVEALGKALGTGLVGAIKLHSCAFEPDDRFDGARTLVYGQLRAISLPTWPGYSAAVCMPRNAELRLAKCVRPAIASRAKDTVEFRVGQVSAVTEMVS